MKIELSAATSATMAERAQLLKFHIPQASTRRNDETARATTVIIAALEDALVLTESS